MSSKALASILGLAAIGGLIVGAWLWYTPAPPPLPTLFPAPDFSLTDSRGQTLTQTDLAGKLWVADFFFSNCPGPCPAMTRNMARIHQQFPDGSRVRLVNFSVDPENDTPEKLTKYAKRHDADTSRWHFLTGPGEQIHDISVKGFKIGDPERLILHSQKFVLVDGEGQIRGYYEGTDAEEVDALMADMERLLD